MDKYGNVEFDIHCRMKARWVPHFLAMLKRMQANGEAGNTALADAGETLLETMPVLTVIHVPG